MVSGHTPELKVGEISLKYSAVDRTQIYIRPGFFRVSIKNYGDSIDRNFQQYNESSSHDP